MESKFTRIMIEDLKSGKRRKYTHHTLSSTAVVDTDLKDTWLDSLNELKTLSLLSICSGHFNQNHYKYPELLFRPKPQYTQDFMCKVIEVVKVLRLSRFKTNVDVSPFTCKSTGGSIVVNVRLIVAPMKSGDVETDSDKRDWFERVVSTMNNLDALILEV